MPRKQQYLLPLEAIVAAMQQSPDMVSLQAQLPSLPTLARESCIAELLIGRGTLHTCAIRTQTGQLLMQQKEAYTYLQQLGDVAWCVHLIAFPHDSFPLQERPLPRQMSPPPSNGMRNLPMRTAPSLSSVQMRTLAPTHKHVFSLVDGTKTVEQIARLLSKSASDIQKILHDLQEMNLITW